MSWFGFSGADNLACLSEVSFEGLSAVWTMTCSVRAGEARPTGVVAGFDGGKPGGLDREPSGCMQVVQKGFYAWKIGGTERSRSAATCWKGNVVKGVVVG